MIGSHIASGRSHTTGRTHDLSFRAGTAVFGHLGIEWDITRATPEELAQLQGWIAWYKAHRTLLLSGEVVRVDLPEQGAFLRGVVSPDAAVFSLALGEAPATGTLGRVVLPGLVPEANYRVRLVPLSLVGAAPPGSSSAGAGVGVPPWFVAPDGIVLTGAALAASGVQTPWPIPEHAVLLEVERVG
jgi:alpha-galactosidase